MVYQFDNDYLFDFGTSLFPDHQQLKGFLTFAVKNQKTSEVNCGLNDALNKKVTSVICFVWLQVG